MRRGRGWRSARDRRASGAQRHLTASGADGRPIAAWRKESIMKAIQIQSYGGLEVLRTTTLSDPDPGPDEVLVRIKASAVNPLDGIVRMGHFPIAKGR